MHTTCGSKAHQLLERFVLHYCHSLFDQATKRPGSEIGHDVLHFVHKIVFTQVLHDQQQHGKNTHKQPIKALSFSYDSLKDKSNDSSIINSLDKIVNARLPTRKPELLELVDLLSNNKQATSAASETNEELQTPAPSRMMTMPTSKSRVSSSDRYSSSSVGTASAQHHLHNRQSRRTSLGALSDKGPENNSACALSKPAASRASSVNTSVNYHQEPIKRASHHSKESQHRKGSMDHHEGYETTGRKGSHSKSAVYTEDKMAILRDVVYCLQGIDGQHLKYSNIYQRFLINREIPLARPSRILVSRLVASGNCFVRIGHATKSTQQQLQIKQTNRTTEPTLQALPITKQKSAWRDWAGAVGALDSQKKAAYEKTPIDVGLTIGTRPCWSVTHKASAVVFALLEAIREELALYYEFLGDLEDELGSLADDRPTSIHAIVGALPMPKLMLSSASRKLLIRLKPWLKLLHCLAELVDITTDQVGGEILSTLWEARLQGDPTRAKLSQKLFKKAAVPMHKFIHEWVINGILLDEHNEFFFKNATQDTSAYYSLWKEGPEIDWQMVPTCFPEWYIKRLFAAGKMAYFIRVVKGDSCVDSLTGILHELSSSSPFNVIELPNTAIQSTGIAYPDERTDLLKLPDNGGNICPPVFMSTATRGTHQEEPGPFAWLSGMPKPPLSYDAISLKGLSDHSRDVQTKSDNNLRGLLTAGDQSMLERPDPPWAFPNFQTSMIELTTAESYHLKKIRDVLIGENALLDHLKALKAFVLLGAGDFTENMLSGMLALILQNEGTDLISQSDMDICVIKSFNSSVLPYLMASAYSDRVKARKIDQQEQFGNSPWDFFSLDYECKDSPVSVVIRDELLSQYRRIFALLWKLRRSIKQQCEVWLTNMRNSFLLAYPQAGDLFLESQSLRQQILHMLQSWEAFLYNDILDPVFNTLIAQINGEQWSNLDELIEIHESFVQAVLFGMFLDDWPSPEVFSNEAIPTTKDVSFKPFADDDDEAITSLDSPLWDEAKFLPNVQASLLSASFVLPSYKYVRRQKERVPSKDTANHPPNSNNVLLELDAIFEISSEFTIFMDSLQISAYNLIKSELPSHDVGDENQNPHEGGSNSLLNSRDELDNHANHFYSFQRRFNTHMKNLLKYLRSMQLKYRSDSIQALIIRLDLNDYYTST